MNTHILSGPHLGTYQFPAMRRLAINSGDAFILVYSVENPKSLDDLEQMRQSILEERERAYLEASALSSCSSSSACSSSNLAEQTEALWAVSSVVQDGAGGGLDYQHHPSGTTKQQWLPTMTSEPGAPASPMATGSRHWSLASLFGGHGDKQVAGSSSSSSSLFGSAGQSCTGMVAPGIGGASGSSTSESSRRSSASAAEAALKTRRTRRPPMVIVANKCDLPENQHLVNNDEVEALAVIDWNNGFVRASAALNQNIDEIFQQVLRQAKQPPTLTEAILSKRRRSLPPKLPNQILPMAHQC